MTPESIIYSTYQKGQALLAQQMNTLATKRLYGTCKVCKQDCDEIRKVSTLLFALLFRLTSNKFDEFTEKLYVQLLALVGGTVYVPDEIYVDAGADRTVLPGTAQVLTAEVTLAENPLDTVLWERVSGPNVVLENADTLSVTVPGFSGVLVLRVTVTDTMGTTAVSQITITSTSGASTVFPYTFPYALS